MKRVMTNKRYLYTSPPISSPSLSLYQGLSQNSRLPLNPLANQNVLYQTCTIFRYTHMAEHTAGNCSPKNHPTQSSHCLPNIYQIKCYFFLLGWFMSLPNHIILLVLETNVAPRKKGVQYKIHLPDPIFGAPSWLSGG